MGKHVDIKGETPVYSFKPSMIKNNCILSFFLQINIIGDFFHRSTLCRWLPNVERSIHTTEQFDQISEPCVTTRIVAAADAIKFPGFY